MEIQCKFVDFRWINVSSEAEILYTCEATAAEIKSPIHMINKFNGVHKKGKRKADVRGIRFLYISVEHFPRDLHKHFPNLTHLQILNCGLQGISKEDLKGLENLISLSIIDCKLKSLPDNLLEDMPKLEKVDFRNNEIEVASSKLLEPLRGRENLFINLFGNKNIKAFLAPGQPCSLKTLQELMDVIDKKCIKPKQHSVQASVGKLKDFNPKIAELWTSGRFSDLTVVVGKKRFKVHKTILGMDNPTFAKIIEDHSEAKELKISDFSSDVVEALLHFIYTGEVLNHENAQEKFRIAEKFKIAEMKSAFEKILSEQIDRSNAFDIFMFGTADSSQFLKEKAFTVISEMFPEKLPAKLMEDPEKLKRIIEHRREFDSLLKD